MSVAWAPKLSTELHTEPTRHAPPFLSILIPEEEKEGVVIDCDKGGCERKADYWVSCGGKRQSMCSLHLQMAFLNWLIEAAQ